MQKIDPNLVDFAKRMSSDPQFKALMTALKGNALAELVGTAPDEAEQRELLYRRVRAYDDMEASLNSLSVALEFGGNNGT